MFTKSFGKFRRFRKMLAIGAGVSILLSFGAIGWSGVHVGGASWYALWGQRTGCGDIVTGEDWTAAHKTLPCGQKITVCYKTCARGVVITDRGPYVWGRDLDLNKPVSDKIGLTYVGADKVTWWETGYDPNYAYK